MKTQILHLEAHDDLISTRDKLGWRQTGRILLVWPRSGNVLRRQYDLLVVQRHASQHGAQLALVTNDQLVRFNAQLLGIPVFSDPEEAQKSTWKRRGQRQSLPDLKQDRQPHAIPKSVGDRLHTRSESHGIAVFGRILMFSLGVFAIFALAAVLLPSAAIEITPILDTQQLSITSQANPDITDFRLTGEFPIEPITFILEGRESIPSSGFTNIPQEYASGFAEFTNLTESTVQIPTGTIITSLEHTDLRYLTTRASTLGAGIGETISIPIQAALPGKLGNIPANRLNAIEGNLGLSVSVKNSEPIRGGSDVRVSATRTKDRESVYSLLYGRLVEEAQAEVSNHNSLTLSLDPGDILVSSKPVVIKVLEETYQPEVDLPSDKQSLTLRLEFEVQVVKGDLLRQFAQSVLDANLSLNAIPILDSMVIEHKIGNKPSDEGVFSWQMEISRQVSLQPSEPEILNLVMGKTPEAAEDIIFRSLSLDRKPLIKLNPEWWPRIPFVPFRISLTTHPATDSP